MTLLARHGLAGTIEARGLPVQGMWLTGPGGIGVAGTYPRGLLGRSLTRADLDVMLVSAAERAGAVVELGVRVTRPLTEGDARRPRVTGIAIASRAGRAIERRARVVIAADGRRSTLAVALGLIRSPKYPRRWALGAYYEGVDGLTRRGEMHVRSGRYLGVAPVPNGLANVCLVVPEAREIAPGRALPHRGDQRIRRVASESLQIRASTSLAGLIELDECFADRNDIDHSIVASMVGCDCRIGHGISVSSIIAACAATNRCDGARCGVGLLCVVRELQ